MADVIDLEHDIPKTFKFSTSQTSVLQPGIDLPPMDSNKHTHTKPLCFSHSVRRHSCSRDWRSADNHGFLRQYLRDANNWVSPTSIPDEGGLGSILCNTSTTAHVRGVSPYSKCKLKFIAIYVAYCIQMDTSTFTACDRLDPAMRQSLSQSDP